MATISVQKWWKAHEIPLVETDWRNIRLYCDDNDDVWNWNQCVYFIRLAPPYQIAYGNDDKFHSPLIYVGKSAIRQRWSEHRVWMEALGRWLPGARYEVWLFQHALCKGIESDALLLFRENYGRLPLANRRSEEPVQKHSYDDSFYQVAKADRRYWWALRPTQADVEEYFDKGVVPAK